MSELMQLLTGAKPYPIPACAIRPMPLLEAEGADDEPCECSSCKQPGLTAADFYHSQGRILALQEVLLRVKECETEGQQVKTIIRIIQRAALGFEIWAIEQHIEDLQRVMRETNNLNHYRSAMIEIHAARTDLASARSRRDSLLPVGVRNTYKSA